MAEIYSDLDICKVELTKIWDEGHNTSTILNNLEGKYKYLLSARVKERDKIKKKEIVVDEIASFIIEDQKLNEFIPNGMKPARYALTLY